MGTIEDPLSSNRGFIFTPNNPRLPVEPFLSMIESEASLQDLSTHPSLLIAQTLSAIDQSEIEDQVLESLQEQKTWEDFKCEMIKHFHLTDTLRNKVELIKGAFKQDSEDVTHFVIRARHTAHSIEMFNAEECAKLLFLAGLPDQETNFCFDNIDVNGHDLDILADLINSNSDFNVNGESSKSSVANKIENNQTIEEGEILDQDMHISVKEENIASNSLNTRPPSPEKSRLKCRRKQTIQAPSLPDEITNPHLKPNLSMAQLITEVLVDAPEGGITSKEIMCKIARKYPFYKFDTSRPNKENSNWTRKVQKIISDTKESCPFTGSDKVGGQKKWTLKQGYEILILKRLGWLKTDSNDVALLDIFLDGFGSGQRTFDEYINAVSNLGLVGNKSVETVRLIYAFWARDSTNVPALNNKSAKIKAFAAKPIKTEHLAVQPIKTEYPAAKQFENESHLFTCDQCDFKTDLAVWLEKHKSKGHVTSYHCPEPNCFYQTKANQDSEEETQKYNHRINYHSEYPHFSKGSDGYYHCPQDCCKDKESKFKSKIKSLLLKHLNCDLKKGVICEICAKVFVDNFGLKNHITSVHGGEARFVCHHDACVFRTNSEHKLKHHVRSVHDKIKDLVCDKCPYRTAEHNNLRRHMKSHADVSERTFYGCILCETTTTQKVGLKKHMEMKHQVKLTGKVKIDLGVIRNTHNLTKRVGNNRISSCLALVTS